MLMRTQTLLLSFILAVALPFSAPVWAAATDWQKDEGVAVRLIAALDGVGEEPDALVGFDIRLDDGWHTYWRSPGEAGVPPALDWKGSENLGGAELMFPAPDRFSLQGVDFIGYEDHVLLPARIRLINPGESLILKVKLDLLVCNELCLPKTFDLALTIPQGSARRGAEAARIDEAVALLPSDKPNSALQITRLRRTTDTIHLDLSSDRGLVAPDIFVETQRGLAFGRPIVKLADDGSTGEATIKLQSDLNPGESLVNMPMTITVVDDGPAAELKLAPGESIGALHHEAPLPYWAILLLAVLGGFILNLMPCVLPVLSLKLMGLIKHGGGEKRTVRLSFLSTAGGIVFSFALLASLTIALKATGQAFGWGVQFQQPVFLTFMIVLLTLFAANLWSFFEIELPRFIMDSFDPTHHPKLAGDFATGALATLLATPCSAPFLGTAVGFALTAGPSEIVAVFLALGLGMALPYFGVAAWPQVASALPRPGEWMVTLSRLLGLGLAATAVWLLFVLNAQIGFHGAMFIAAAMLVLLGLLYLRHRKIAPSLAPALGLLIAGGALLLAFLATTPHSLQIEKGLWQSFDEETLARHLREGKTVFVDVTADWCLTCKVNKRLALADEKVMNKLFNTSGIVALQADWTNPDPAITAFLHKHGRYGIPFNAVFGPRAPDGLVLPELLTSGMVLDSLAIAQGPPKACPVDLPKGTEC